MIGPRAASASPAFAAAPSHAETAKRRRVAKMSGRFPNALTSVPATNPSCTASVSHAVAESVRPHSALSAGATAEAENQSDMPSSSASGDEGEGPPARGRFHGDGGGLHGRRA